MSVYEARLASNSSSVREHRFLAQAYVAAHAFAKALDVAEAGLVLAPDDASLLATRGEARAGLGDVDGALADWRLVLDLQPDDIGALYSTAFLLEREERLAEAADAWKSIVSWNEERGLELETVWPQQELDRLRAHDG